ncbi:hypothetical protein LPJ61_002525 [Coemansia biformis]|uniref:WW domain-containing protein n=1 Tax=Coemansia biformis TaxID=1286918 RepID=A0A9W8CZ40_9FUNG|nr:hypothetical protein LPJ61_002525 [Coemansia biformis]
MDGVQMDQPLRQPQLPPEALAGSGHDWAVFLAPGDAQGRPHMPQELYYYERNNGITTWIRPFDYVEPDNDANPDAVLAVGERWKREDTEKKRLKARQRAKQDRPTRQAPVGNTVWRRVETVQGRVYYYNTSTKASQWGQPEEVAEALLAMDLDEKEEEEGPADSGQEAMAAVEAVGTEMTAEDAEWMLAQMGENIGEPGSDDGNDKPEEPDNSKEQPRALPKSECVAHFKEMLLESKLDPFGAWDTQKSKIEDDPRFAALDNDVERQDLFDEACREILEQRRRQKAESATMAGGSDPFEQLLAEKVKKKMSFAKFCQRNLKDPRYLSVKTSREREKQFMQFLDSL